MNKVIKLLGENPNAVEVLRHLGSSSVYNYLNTTRGGLELLLRSPEFQNLEKTCNGKSNPIEINLFFFFTDHYICFIIVFIFF